MSLLSRDVFNSCHTEKSAPGRLKNPSLSQYLAAPGQELRDLSSFKDGQDLGGPEGTVKVPNWLNIDFDEIGFQLGDALGRLRHSKYIDSIAPLSKNEVIGSYYIWLRKLCMLVFESETFYSLSYASKRGNGLYSKRVKEKWNRFDVLETDFFFNPKDIRNCKGKKTKMLFVTGTVDTKRYSRRAAWLNVGKEWNRFLSSLVRSYGKIQIARTWESTLNGYPHLHALMYFEESSFSVAFAQIEDSGKRKFRIMEREQVRRNSKGKLRWRMGFVDIQACYSTDAWYYLGKYVSKFVNPMGKESSEGAVTTLAYCWLYQKRSYSISREFLPRLDVQGCIIQTMEENLSNSDKKTEFVGLVFLDATQHELMKEGWWHKFHKDTVPDDIKRLVDEARFWSDNRKERLKSELERCQSYRKKIGS